MHLFENDSLPSIRNWFFLLRSILQYFPVPDGQVPFLVRGAFVPIALTAPMPMPAIQQNNVNLHGWNIRGATFWIISKNNKETPTKFCIGQLTLLWTSDPPKNGYQQFASPKTSNWQINSKLANWQRPFFEGVWNPSKSQLVANTKLCGGLFFEMTQKVATLLAHWLGQKYTLFQPICGKKM